MDYGSDWMNAFAELIGWFIGTIIGSVVAAYLLFWILS